MYYILRTVSKSAFDRHSFCHEEEACLSKEELDYEISHFAERCPDEYITEIHLSAKNGSGRYIFPFSNVKEMSKFPYKKYHDVFRVIYIENTFNPDSAQYMDYDEWVNFISKNQ